MMPRAKTLIAVLSLFAALTLSPPAPAGESQAFAEAQARYLQTAKEYRWKAEDLAGRKPGLTRRQQAIVVGLIAVYEQLADTKVALAAAIGARDWGREERLEQSYYRLKDREARLWDQLDETKS